MANQKPHCSLSNVVLTIVGEIKPDADGQMPDRVATTHFEKAENTPYWCKECDQEFDEWADVQKHLEPAEQAKIWEGTNV